MTNDAISAVIIADTRPVRRNSDICRPPGPDSGNGPAWQSWLALCTPRCDDVTMVAADPLTLLDCGRLIVSDHFDPPTLLSGLHAGLFAARHDYLLATYAGMPVVAPAMIDLLLDTIEPRFDAVVFQTRDGHQLMPAAYSKRSLKPLARQLAKGNHQARGFLRQLRIQVIDEDQWRARDPEWQPLLPDADDSPASTTGQPCRMASNQFKEK